VTEIGDDDAVIAHRPTEQSHATAGSGSDQATIDDRTGRAAGERRKPIVPAHEVFDIDIQTGCHQATHLDPRAGAEDHAVGIHDEHLAVGLDAAVDLARQLVEDSVQSRGRGRRLLEPDQLVAAHIESGPVDDQGRRLLLDERGVDVGPPDAAAARHHLTAGGPGRRLRGNDEAREHDTRHGGSARDARQRRPSAVGALPRTIRHFGVPWDARLPPGTRRNTVFLGVLARLPPPPGPCAQLPHRDQSDKTIGNPGHPPGTVSVVTVPGSGDPQN